MNILVINCGSSSLKFQLINTFTEEVFIKDSMDNIHAENEFEDAIQTIISATKDFKIDAVGHRVVHGGNQFRSAVFIDDEVKAVIEKLAYLAPLHNPNNLKGIRAFEKALPDIPHIAVFDTAFHAGLPRRAYTYSLPSQIREQYNIRRYGFHGTSHEYVAQKVSEHLGQPLNSLRIISLHLGNGASACAIEFGHSTETSMGMTPLEGLVMGTRVGDLDPGALICLQKETGMSLDEIDHLLNKESGLKGLSGISHDMQEIEHAAKNGDDNARLAIAVFCHRVRKYVGAYAATMGGLDAIVVTGGIGENSTSIRQRILQRLEFLGLILDDDANHDCKVSHDNTVHAIHAEYSKVKACVVKTNEELNIANKASDVIKTAKHVNLDQRIPIAVSARHVHLTQESFEQLFGKGEKPTHFKDLYQPGQYACNETVKLIGPKGNIEHVRVLGPLRSKNQVEISRTDEFHLGVDAPVRDSGKIQGSAPITLEGPAGKVHLEEGLICARRHIHMHPDDAKRFGVNNKDEVEIAIRGGERDLIFCDVLIRVSPGYKLEMHIDTDEANAAELSRTDFGSLVYTNIDDRNAQLIRKIS